MYWLAWQYSIRKGPGLIPESNEFTFFLAKLPLSAQIRGSNPPKIQFLFSNPSKTFHKNNHFDQGLMVIGQKITELLEIEISKMDPDHPVVYVNSRQCLVP